eukprot:206307-Chlamydomonas_euryale.AAC.1
MAEVSGLQRCIGMQRPRGRQRGLRHKERQKHNPLHASTHGRGEAAQACRCTLPHLCAKSCVSEDGIAGGTNAGGAATAATRWPPVAMVMPVKGVRPHSVANWNSHLGASYPGRLYFFFVVEAETDPAFDRLTQLSASACSKGRDARVVVAGESSRCSQKIHK